MICRLWLTGLVVPYTRMTQGSKWTPRARRYLDWQGAARLELRAQMATHGWQMIPRGEPLQAWICIRPVSHRRDLDNCIKAVLDAAQGVVFEDDRWIDQITAWQARGETGVTLGVGRVGERP